MPRVSHEEFLEAWEKHKSAAKVAKFLGMTERAVYTKRRAVEAAHGIELSIHEPLKKIANKLIRPPDLIRNYAEVTGPVVVFSDAHYFPGEPSIGHQALLRVIKKVKPAMVVANGDIMDGARISRFAAEGWGGGVPTVKQELEAVIQRMREIEQAAPKGCFLHRTIGNHDTRFDKRLVMQVAEFEGIQGFCLSDHLPKWSASMSLLVNENCMVKHRYHNGIHSSYNNVLKSGMSMVTGHTHILEVKGYTDYTGRRWGVSTGMLCDPEDKQFDYAEDAPKNWCQGFAILHFENDGRLLPPELVEVVEGNAYWRGNII